MTGYSRVVVMGNLTRQPELRHVPSGTAVLDMGVAANETYRAKDGQTVETTCFVDIVVWGKQAEACGQYLAKGAPVLVEGRLQLDQWQGKEGEKRSRLRVRADRVRFLGGRKNGEGASALSTGSGQAGGGGPEEVEAPEAVADAIPF